MEDDTMNDRIEDLEDRVSNLERGELAQYHKDMREAREEGRWTKEDDWRVRWAVFKMLVAAGGFSIGFFLISHFL